MGGNGERYGVRCVTNKRKEKAGKKEGKLFVTKQEGEAGGLSCGAKSFLH